MEQPNRVAEFFATARERYMIKLRRLQGAAWDGPLTEDKNFQQWRFCNVHREDDKTTQWFREHVRNKTTGYKNLESTIIFRWFNRIETGEIIEDLLVGDWDTEEARRRLTGVSPVVTGAYIIKGMDGYSKLDGILYVIDEARQRLPDIYNHWRFSEETSLQHAWNNLRDLHYMGGFMAYEVVSDLRWSILKNAPDIMEWANAGPGAARGLAWVYGTLYNRGSADGQKKMNELMQELLMLSQRGADKDFTPYWPFGWRPWEMREVEHWLCEFDKWCRSDRGDSMKRRFRPCT